MSRAAIDAASSGSVQSVVLEGHLTRAVLDEQLSAISLQLGPKDNRLLVDARSMTDYDIDARAYFVEWNRRHRSLVSRVAVVTRNRLWHMVIRAMALASDQHLKPFFDPATATGWLQR